MQSVKKLVEITNGVTSVADDKITRIHGITRRSRMLALNAAIEAHRFGSEGKGFAVVADEVKAISAEISDLASSLQGELKGRLDNVSQFAEQMNDEVARLRGERLIDLAFNAIEIIDRNLYERSCDVRWWATDAAMVDCCADPSDAQRAGTASDRLAVILDSYTVYLDLWVADPSGRVIATGRPGRYPQAVGTDVAGQQWFREAMATRNGGEFAVADIHTVPALNNAVVAAYSTAIREGGEANGKVIGVLGIFFDWEPQAKAIVEGIRLSPQERQRSTCLLLDSQHRVIASSDGSKPLGSAYPLNIQSRKSGHYSEGHTSVGYALTPGYESYQGLGWYGVIEQRG